MRSCRDRDGQGGVNTNMWGDKGATETEAGHQASRETKENLKTDRCSSGREQHRGRDERNRLRERQRQSEMERQSRTQQHLHTH